MSHTRRNVLLGLAMTLAACQLPGAGDPPNLYTLTPVRSFAPNLPRVDWQLIVEPPVTAAGLSTSRIALQRSPVTLEYYAHSNWSDAAPVLVQTLLVESFENTGRIVGVSREATGLRADYILRPDLRAFQAVYDNARAPNVLVRLTVKLVRVTDRTIIGNHTAEQTVRAESGELRDIARAFDQALGAVMRDVVEWTLTAPATVPPPRRS